MKYAIKRGNQIVHGPFTSPEIEVKRFLEEMKIKDVIEFKKRGYSLVRLEKGKRVAF